MLPSALLLLGLAILRVLLSIGEVIPYVGPFLQEINPLLTFFILLGIGWHISEVARRLTETGRRSLVVLALLACSLTFIGPFAAEYYYTLPLNVARTLAVERHHAVPHTYAVDSVRTLLRNEMGSDGVVAYAIYRERQQLSGRNLAAYAAKQFEDLDDLGGIFTALLNIVLHTIPMLIKWLLCQKLGWSVEPGWIGLIYWYVFSLLVSYVGYRTA